MSCKHLMLVNNEQVKCCRITNIAYPMCDFCISYEEPRDVVMDVLEGKDEKITIHEQE